MTRLELGEEEGAGAPASVSKIAGNLLKNSAPPWCFVPKVLTPDTVNTLQKAVPRPCRRAPHPAPNQGDPPLFTYPAWGVLRAVGMEMGLWGWGWGCGDGDVGMGMGMGGWGYGTVGMGLWGWACGPVGMGLWGWGSGDALSGCGDGDGAVGMGLGRTGRTFSKCCYTPATFSLHPPLR